MRAVIIEDNQIFAEQFCEGLLKQCRERKLELEAEVLQEKELEEVRSLRRLYDLYFLDIEMPVLTGIELAKELRRKHVDREIIFVSGHEQYMRQAFPVKPLAFIRKDHWEEDLAEVIKLLEEQDSFRRAEVTLGRERITAQPFQILYCQSVEHYVKLFCLSEEIPLLRMKLDQLEKILEPYFFLRVHERYLVNINYIEQMSRGTVQLRDGTELPVSRSQQKQVAQRLMQWFERNR